MFPQSFIYNYSWNLDKINKSLFILIKRDKYYTYASFNLKTIYMNFKLIEKNSHEKE